jgi:hypothetical protein
VFRTDPLTDDGKFDVDFFSSPYYKRDQENLIRYLYWEGFEAMKKPFIIDFQCRRWQIVPVKKK